MFFGIPEMLGRAWDTTGWFAIGYGWCKSAALWAETSITYNDRLTTLGPTLIGAFMIAASLYERMRRTKRQADDDDAKSKRLQKMEDAEAQRKIDVMLKDSLSSQVDRLKAELAIAQRDRDEAREDRAEIREQLDRVLGLLDKRTSESPPSPPVGEPPPTPGGPSVERPTP